MDWVGANPPDYESLAGATLVDQGTAHIKAITYTGGQILGCRDLGLDSIVGLRKVSHRRGGVVYLYEGATRLRPATPEEAAAMPLLGVWGFGFIAKRADRLFSAR